MLLAAVLLASLGLARAGLYGNDTKVVLLDVECFDRCVCPAPGAGESRPQLGPQQQHALGRRILCQLVWPLPEVQADLD